MAGDLPGARDCAERLRGLARELKTNGRWPQPASAGQAADLAACLEWAAQALAPAPAAPAPPPSPPARSAAGSLVLFADGGSRGNPGPAGAGAVLVDSAGRQVATWHRYLGHATNNVAEYQALIMGLEGVLDLGATELAVRLDSELLVRQINGAYQVKSPQLKPLYQQARALAGRFARISFQHIPREQNVVADRLANLAMDNPVPGPV